MKQKKLLNILIVTALAAGAVILVVFLSGRGGGSVEPKGTYHSPTVFAMDTSLDITIQGRSPEQARKDAGAAIALARRIESRTSRFDPDSDVSLINRSAGVAPVKVSDDTMYLVGKSVEYGKAMGGGFDITIAPAVSLWGFYDQRYRVPSQSEIDAALALVGQSRIVIDPAAGTVFLPLKGMELDLGGVAKGFAVQKMYELLESRGVESALLNFGGSVGALGRRSDGKKWVIGVRHPRVEGGALAGELEVENRFVNTSGDYERFFIKDGKRYFHILDPATGRQPEGTMSATVVGPDAMVADILSKAPFVMGTQNGLHFIEGQAGFEALAIDSTGKVEYTPNMKSEYVVTMTEKI
jgi:FAD:protein FMN transferase